MTSKDFAIEQLKSERTEEKEEGKVEITTSLTKSEGKNNPEAECNFRKTSVVEIMSKLVIAFFAQQA